MVLVQFLLYCGFSFLLCVPSWGQSRERTITLDLPASFTVRYEAASPSQCYRVARPADGRITASIAGPGTWELCVGDQMCPTDCFDSGLRTVTTQPLTQGTHYFVKVMTKTPGVAATLTIRAAGGAGPGGMDVSGDWESVGDSPDVTQALVTLAQTGNRVSAQARFLFRGAPAAWSGEGTLTGTQLRLPVVYSKLPPGWNASVNGRWEMTVAGDGQSLSGRWFNQSGQSGSITYRRARGAGGGGMVTPGAGSVAGRWVATGDSGEASNAQVTFTQTGSAITTRATFLFRGTPVSWHGTGNVEGRRLETTVVYDKLYPGWTSAVNGRWVMTLSEDCRTMAGHWHNQSGQSGAITYRRVE